MHGTVEVAPSAYLASLHATSALVKVILPVSLPSSEPSLFDGDLSYWSEGHDFQPLDGVDALKQKSWDQQWALAAVHQLVEGALNGVDRQSTPAWPQALRSLEHGCRLFPP